MNPNLLDDYAFQLEKLKQQNNFRQFYSIQHQGKYLYRDGIKMLNLASNDYLSLTQDSLLRTQFLQELDSSSHDTRYYFSSSSSRLLTGNFTIYEQLESTLSQAFQQRSALLFNSGYHMNIGILPALCDDRTLILADKWVHASIIDGIRLSSAKYIRYQHQNLGQLEQLLIKYHDEYSKIIIVTESIFSMDGDETDLLALVALKQRFSKVMLYLDEAHAIGVRGEKGLGCAEQYHVIDQIDFLVGTFGKALASIGGYLICHDIIRQYLINTMRPLIFSTALPPICVAWTDFVFQRLTSFVQKRQRLHQLSQHCIETIQTLGYYTPSTSHIVPIILGENEITLTVAQRIQYEGIYLMAVRPPTVPKGQSRLRICLQSDLSDQDIQQLTFILNTYLPKKNL